MCSPKFCCLCPFLLLFFLLPLIFTLLAVGISYFLTAAMKIFMFFIQRNSSPHEFLITRYSCFSVNHVNADIKNNVGKESTFLLFFF